MKRWENLLLFQSPKGTTDILPEEQPYWRFLETTVEEITEIFSYDRIDTPMFEDARLFVRGVGQITDIVEKETYTFEDRGGDAVTLRPEGTAPVCRAYLENGMHNLPQPVRLYYLCPVFRYERPQAGRYRQHHQFGVEVFGDGDSAVDAEVIEIGWRFLEKFGISEKSLGLNSIGDSVCRPDYINQLEIHYRPNIDNVCSDCRRRFDQNPLRLLDCKKPVCAPIIQSAPRSTEYLCGDCRKHWDTLLIYLEQAGIPHEVDHTLVRGFDYYTRTVFEIKPPSNGSQSTMIGGGRYDGLIEQLGGKPTPGIGFGMGIERAILNLKAQQSNLPTEPFRKMIVAYLGTEGKSAAAKLASELRLSGKRVVLAPDRGLKSQLRYGTSISATHAIIIGEDEIKKSVLTVRDLENGVQTEIGRHNLGEIFAHNEN